MINLQGYTLSQKVYEGTETVVYRGHRRADGVPVAVKVTRSDYPTARETARLRREFGVLQHIQDLPGVVRGYALEKHGRGLALVMEDLGDTSLEDRLKAERLDVRSTLTIAISLATTLEGLHHRSIIHKDIKPRNLMMDAARPGPLVVDFGISSRLAQELQSATSPAALEGTLAYLSPEQTGRMNLALDLRTDLYSLGVTLYEMMTGELPFASSDPTELIHSHLARAPMPPHERSPGVPPFLSEVVMRLLAKMPDERYQSARGLKIDLEECLARWDATGQIDPFPLGREDHPDRLSIPQKLYGRKDEVALLLSAFERVRRGATELALISGYAGLGKSALVNEIHKPIAQTGGYFVHGKFDQLSRSIPLAALVYALRGLIRQILAEPADALYVWKVKLLQALGGNGRLLVELIPELEPIVGPQPEIPALGSTEARNRFGLLVQRFVRVFAGPKHPLVIFLDDLQWADAASLQLLGMLLSDPESKHLLIVGAYRDNEVDAAHPLLSTLREVRKAGAPVVELTLKPLDLPTVTALVADALHAPARSVTPLAALVFEKTQGNPFFLGQFLGTLHEERLLSLDPSTGRFTWDLERIRGAMVTDNVVELMLAKLSRLTPATRQALVLAAGVGHAFDLGALSAIAEQAPEDSADALWEALREGLIVPQGGDYRFLDANAGAAKAAADLHISYRFLHDRVREAAYSLVEQGSRAALHLRIGRLLWARSGKEPSDEDLLEIVRHLNEGAAGVTDPTEREEIAALDLRAGKKAKAATAYEAAARCFNAGAALLGEAGWEHSYALAFALHAEAAECDYLHGATEQADERFDELLRRAKTPLERARVHDQRVILYATRGKFSDALREGLAGLALLGVTLPETPEERQAAFGAWRAEVNASLGERRVEDLIHAKEMVDPERLLVMQLLGDLGIPVYSVDQSLYVPLVLKMVNLSLTEGHSELSPFAYITYAFILTAFLGQPAQGYAFGRLALELHERQKNVALTCKLYLVFTGILFLGEPVRNATAYDVKARQCAEEYGDFLFLSDIWRGELVLRFALGEPLQELSEAIEQCRAVTRRTQDRGTFGVMTTVKQVIANLRGQTKSRSSLSDDGFDEATFRAGLSEKDEAQTVAYFHLLKLYVQYLHGDYAGAAAEALEAERLGGSAIGHYALTQLDLYACLTLLALPPAATPEEAERRAEAVARHKAKIAALAAICPTNFQQTLLLIEAEQARVEGRHADAIDLCDRAVELAKKSELVIDEALANEFAAKAYLALGKPKLARPYMTDAYLGYLHWGATAKAEDIAQSHADLLPRMADGAGRTSGSLRSGASANTTLLGTTIGSIREAALVVRAAQAIAGELELPRVIKRLMKIVIENAGAQRGALLLARGERLFVEATFGVAPEEIKVGPREALEARDDFPESVARFVARTREPVVVEDAHADPRFFGDPYIAARRARSVLCLPIAHQGRLGGLLYLEHKDLPDAFNSARVELLGLFASQAAIAIDNALLVADVRAANEEVRRVNGRLEAEVAERTEDLVIKNQRLSIELAQRERAEREREKIQEQMIEIQRARLVEMSTPLIPITDRIMVMPLIGTVDAERATQVLQVALEGAQRTRASVVILDITGVRHVDAQVVSSLLGTASALRLLGVRVVLTGIRAEVAQAMVALETNLSCIVTKGTLQGGIAYALEYSGESWQRPSEGLARQGRPARR